jgi:hypothetical protein
LVILGFELRVYVLARQVLYGLSHNPSHRPDRSFLDCCRPLGMAAQLTMNSSPETSKRRTLWLSSVDMATGAGMSNCPSWAPQLFLTGIWCWAKRHEVYFCNSWNLSLWGCVSQKAHLCNVWMKRSRGKR